MGKEIENAAKRRSHSIAAIADPAYHEAGIDSNLSSMKKGFESCDVLVDFSIASAVVEHVKFAAEVKRAIVIGTTGWQKDMDEVKRIVNECGIAAVVGSNFSLGVNLFISTVEKAARLFGQFDGFDCAVLESHHNQKADAPSGTAIMIGSVILENFPMKKRIRLGLPDGRISKDELQINSIRVGSDYGTHSVLFDSDNDRIELTHTSRGRRGLALGAVLAAEWANGKKGFYQFKEILNDLV
jgi:4-hydroxy-tetrahydrodipicolinate reductase